jgi:hypothetical protein
VQIAKDSGMAEEQEEALTTTLADKTRCTTALMAGQMWSLPDHGTICHVGDMQNVSLFL